MVRPALASKSSPLTEALRLLPPWLREAFAPVPESERAGVEEIRINQARPLMARSGQADWFVTPEGFSESEENAFLPTERQVLEVLDALTSSSVYALDEAMRCGFLPMPGGHRAGLVGEVRMDGGRVQGFRYVTGFNIRLSRAVEGPGASLLPHLRKAGGSVWSTLVLSPPGCGKTTLLRELIRLLGRGDARAGVRPHRVGVADERSELAGCFRGVPQLDVGPRVDVIDGAPKRFALSMLIRTMSPEVVVTDELGHPGDAEAVLDAVGAGVTLLCSAHGSSVEELAARPTLRPLFEAGVFHRAVVLSRRRGPGTIERIVAGRLGG